MKDIRIITTGGTFDKKYDHIKGELVFRESQLPKILADARISGNVILENILAVDSLFMNEEMRERIAKAVLNSKEEAVIIIHGTDTMVETAKVIAKTNDKQHVVVLTGAMIPYSLENSDAEFNLGVAYSAVQLLEKGVYIAMGGRVYNYDEVKKNRERGVFEKWES